MPYSSSAVPMSFITATTPSATPVIASNGPRCRAAGRPTPTPPPPPVPPRQGPGARGGRPPPPHPPPVGHRQQPPPLAQVAGQEDHQQQLGELARLYLHAAHAQPQLGAVDGRAHQHRDH